MSYTSQKLLNYLPSWSKGRKDPSSFIHRLMSDFNYSFEYQTADAVKTSMMFNLMGEEASNGEFLEIFLEEQDAIKVVMEGTRKTYKYPIVAGTIGANKIQLERAVNISDYLYSLPTRIAEINSVSVIDWSIWSSLNPLVFSEIKTPERLLVEVKDSTIYYNKSSLKEEDRKAGYTSFVYLSGLDQDFKEIQEIISVRDDGCYVTRNIFKVLESVTYDGFDGTVDVFLTSSREGLVDETFIRGKYVSGVTVDSSGPLRFYLVKESFGTVLSPVINILREGKNRNRPENGVQEESLVLLANQALLDSSNNFTNIKSIAVSPVDTRLYALEEDGRVLIYEPKLTPFKNRGTQPSEDTYLDIIPEVHRVDYGEEIDLWTWFRVPTVRVSSVIIKRVNPSGVEEYLQSDMSWGSSTNKFEGLDAEGKFPEESWKDFSFSVTFNELGQWDFYCIVNMPSLRFEQYTSKTSVMVDYLVPLKEFQLEAGEEIFFDKQNFLCIKQLNSYKRFKLCNDLYIADPVSQRVLLKEQYEKVEIYHV